jgi:peptidoglycan-N-acetylglucosamine deacetylase
MKIQRSDLRTESRLNTFPSIPSPYPLPKGERGNHTRLILFSFFLLFGLCSIPLNACLEASEEKPNQATSRFVINLVVDSMSEEMEDTGGVIRINADFDEKNKNTQGNPLPDYQPDVKKGDRIEENDPNLKGASLSIEGESTKGKWKLTFPENIIVWKKSGSGKFEKLISAKLSDEVPIPFACNLKIEGIKGSQTTNDVRILAEFVPDKSKETYRDSVFFTVLETRFVLTFDDGPLPDKTDKIVRVLKNFYCNGKPVKAAFFEIGVKINKFDELTRFVDQNGHMVGNHTQFHERYGHNVISDKMIREDIDSCEVAIRHALGKEPVKIIRNRSLANEDRFDQIAKEMSYKICHGEMLSDWETAPKLTQIEERALRILESWNTKENPRLHPYPSILIFHEFPEVIYDHIGEIILFLQDRGFELANFDPEQIY